MATIKSFTDLEQSKKLAGILPLKSVDMLYWSGEYITHPYMEGQHKDEQIPIWSLAALISVLPRIDIEKEICSDESYDYRVKAYIGDGYIGDWFVNPVDACVEMILKLKESNLL